jgi:hypothetical protein
MMILAKGWSLCFNLWFEMMLMQLIWFKFLSFPLEFNFEKELKDISNKIRGFLWFDEYTQ